MVAGYLTPLHTTWWEAFLTPVNPVLQAAHLVEGNCRQVGVALKTPGQVVRATKHACQGVGWGGQGRKHSNVSILSLSLSLSLSLCLPESLSLPLLWLGA